MVVWEIFNQGELPFPKMNDNSFLNKLKERKLEWKPHPATPPILQNLQVSSIDLNVPKVSDNFFIDRLSVGMKILRTDRPSLI